MTQTSTTSTQPLASPLLKPGSAAAAEDAWDCSTSSIHHGRPHTSASSVLRNCLPTRRATTTLPIPRVNTAATATDTTSTPQRAQLPVLGQWGALVCLCIGVCCFATVPVLGRLLHAPSLIENAWREQATIVVTTPLYLLSRWRSPPTVAAQGGAAAAAAAATAAGEWREALPVLVLGAACNAVWMLTLMVAVELTSVLRATLFNECHTLVIVIGRLVLRRPVSLPEFIGSLFGAAGLAYSGHVQMAAGGGLAGHSSAVGDLIALSGAVCGAGYLSLLHRLPPQMNMLCYSGIVIPCVGLVLTTALSVAVHGVECLPSLLHWMLPANLPLCVLWGVALLLARYLITIGFKEVDATSGSCLLLLQPSIASMLAYVAGLDPLPAPSSLLGILLVMCGCALVNVGVHYRQGPGQKQQPLQQLAVQMEEGLLKQAHKQAALGAELDTIKPLVHAWKDPSTQFSSASPCA